MTLAFSGKEAIRMADQTKFDVAVLDASLPDMPRDELAQMLRGTEQNAGLRIIDLVRPDNRQNPA